MTTTPFNRLTPAEDERLTLIAEEAAEVIQAVAKIQRHGYESCHPSGGPTNRHMLEIELGDLHAVVRMAVDAEDLDALEIDMAAKRKAAKIGQYLHHC